MIKKILKVLGLILIVVFVSLCLIIVIGGRDIATPELSDLMPANQMPPDDQNAYTALSAAADTITMPAELKTIMLYLEGEEIYTSIMEEILLKNISVFASIDDALTRPRCAPPENMDPSAYLSKWYRIGLLLGVRAVNDRRAGRLDQSVKTSVSLMQFSNMIQRDAPKLADYSVGIKLFNLGLEQTDALARADGITSDQLKILAEALTTMGPVDAGLQQAYRSIFKDVASRIDIFRSSKKSIEQTFPDTQSMPYLIRKIKWYPGYIFQENATKRKLAKIYRDSIQNAGQYYADMDLYDLEHYLGLEGNHFNFFCKPNFVGRLFYAFTTPEIHYHLGLKCQLEGELDATQLIVALKTFEKETGKIPDRLEDLVPAYLVKLPMDPFSGQPWLYVPEKRIFYSVSEDLKDSGGSTDIPEGEIYGKDFPKTWVTKDAVFNF